MSTTLFNDPIVTWVTRPERPKGAMNKVMEARRRGIYNVYCGARLGANLKGATLRRFQNFGIAIHLNEDKEYVTISTVLVTFKNLPSERVQPVPIYC